MLCIVILNIIWFTISRCNASKQSKKIPPDNATKPYKVWKFKVDKEQSELIKALQTS